MKDSPDNEFINKKKLKNEIQLLEKELELKELEIIAKRAEIKRKNRFTLTINVSIVIAVISLIGAYVNNEQKNNGLLALEKEKLNSSLILKAVDSESTRESKKMLKFLVELDLITRNAQLDSILKDQTLDVPAIKKSEKRIIKIVGKDKEVIPGLNIMLNGVYIGTTNSKGIVTTYIDFEYFQNLEISVYLDNEECEYESFEINSKGNITLHVNCKP